MKLIKGNKDTKAFSYLRHRSRQLRHCSPLHRKPHYLQLLHFAHPLPQWRFHSLYSLKNKIFRGFFKRKNLKISLERSYYCSKQFYSEVNPNVRSRKHCPSSIQLDRKKFVLIITRSFLPLQHDRK